MQLPSESVGLARPARLAAGYAAMLVVAVALMALIMWYGGTLTAPPVSAAAESAATRAGKATPILPQVLFALVAVIAVGRLLAMLLSKLDQPPVIGEVLAGILLGPSLIGAENSAMILPTSVAPYLGVLAQLGVILYMFVIGLELNAGQLASKAHATVAISHASIVVPFLLGTLLALWLYPRLSHAGVPFTGFAMFLGVSMSVTAFPVLARILGDHGMTRTELGIIALVCAAAGDVTAWCLLAFVVGIVNSSITGAAVTIALATLYLLMMSFVVRPLAAIYLSGQPTPLGSPNPSAEPSTGLITAVLLAVLVSAWTTETIGIHAIFGAFLLGAIIPHDAPIAKVFVEKMGPMAMTLLLPAFFAYVGMRTEIGLVSGLEAWLIVVLIIVVATVGKFGGTYVAARFAGFDSKMSAGLGILMNTRGLMELIVLNIGLDLGVISPKLFAMLVLMAIITTVATTPILKRIYPDAKPVVA